jgi:hypothetical protein
VICDIRNNGLGLDDATPIRDPDVSPSARQEARDRCADPA